MGYVLKSAPSSKLKRLGLQYVIPHSVLGVHGLGSHAHCNRTQEWSLKCLFTLISVTKRKTLSQFRYVLIRGVPHH